MVVSDKVQSYTKTKEAVILLRRLKAWSDIEKVYATKRMRAGKGKMRNRRRIQKKGPLVIYDQDQVRTSNYKYSSFGLELGKRFCKHKLCKDQNSFLFLFIINFLVNVFHIVNCLVVSHINILC